MLNLILPVVLTLIAPSRHPNKVRVGIGTTFHPIEEGLNNGKLACAGGAEWVDPDKPYCAMRQTELPGGMPCGVWVQIENRDTGATAWCKIMDRGPYGKVDNGEWFNAAIEKDRCPKCKFRSTIDMGQSVSAKLGSKGMVRVKVRWWRNNPLSPILDEIYVDEI